MKEKGDWLEGWRARARALKTDIPALFLALKHPRTPFAAKALALLTVGYALSPVDLIPDFIPVLGMLDDLILLPALAALTARLIPPDVFAQCREQAAGLWAQGKPKKWAYALPIIALWLLIAWLIVRRFIPR